MNKYVGPVVSALVVILLAAAYVVFWIFVLDKIEMLRFVKIVITVAAVLFICGIGTALFSRIRELRRGQEDDISKY
jgi:hypothetical protein